MATQSEHLQTQSAPLPGTQGIRQSIARRRLWSWWRRGALLLAAALVIWRVDLWYAPALNGLARSAIAERRLDQAARYLDYGALLAPHDAESWFLRSRIARKQGRLGEVRDCLLRAREAGLPRERVQREEWLTQAQSGEFRAVADRLPELLTEPRGDDQEICEAFVLGAIRTRRTGFAVELLEHWIADFPQSAYPRLLRGQLWMQAEQYESAAADLRAASDLDPADPVARLELADAMVQLRRPAEARLILEQGTFEGPQQTRADLTRAASFRLEGEPDAASRLLTEVLRQDPGHPGALCEMARLELNGGRAAEALRLLEAARSRRTADLEMQYLLAQALQALGRDEEASAQFQRVSETENAHSEIRRLTEEIERTPDDVAARFRIGELTLQFGDPDDAVLWWLSVLDIDPLHASACRRLADYYSGKAASDPAYRDLAAAFQNRLQSLGRAGDAPAALRPGT